MALDDLDIGVNDTSYTPPPAGVHLAVCNLVEDLGDEVDDFNPERKVHKVKIGWQLDKTNPDTGKPHYVSMKFTYSLHERSNLRGMLEEWFGRPLRADERIKLKTLKGKQAQLMIKHKPTSSGRVFPKIVGVTEPPKGSAPVALLDRGDDEPNIPDDAPDWVRNAEG